MILAYRILTNILYPFLIIFLIFRVFSKKEDPIRYKEKIFSKNFNVKKKENFKLLWFHASSIGELKSIIPIIEIINKKKNTEILLTTSTLSSGQLASKEFKNKKNVEHRFMPLDVDHLIKKFLNVWKPEKIFLVDSEIWPNLILNAKKKNIPLALINARITKKSFRRWSMFPKTAENIFGKFNLCLCSNNETRKFLENFKAKNIAYVGNIKLINDIFKKKFDNNNFKILSKSRFWVAASIHKEEEIFCLKTHLEVKKIHQDVITIIAPRHINRAVKIKFLSESLNLKTQVLNTNGDISNNAEIIIINSFGILQNYFKFAKSAFIGKSTIKRLKNDSGQSPIDAAFLGCKIYHGPYVSNFTEIYEILKKNDISKQINKSTELVKNLIIDLKVKRKDKSKKSNSIQALGKNILFDSINLIENFLNDKIN